MAKVRCEDKATRNREQKPKRTSHQTASKRPREAHRLAVACDGSNQVRTLSRKDPMKKDLGQVGWVRKF